MIQNLDVYLWGNKVGTLIAYKERYVEKVCFYFDNDFINKGYDIAPLRASIHSASVKNGLPVYGESDKLFNGLPSFIADSLPDHWGNRVFNEWVKLHNIKRKSLSPLDYLAYIGRRGMGALEFVPPTAKELEMPFKIEIAELYSFSQWALDEARNFKSTLHPDLLIESLFKIGTSAGGRRPKAVVNINKDSKECYSGQVETPYPGFVPMLIKFDEHTDIPTTRIEYSYYLMAKDAGLNMMPSFLMKSNDVAHFVTERFDRQHGQKIHVQTLAAMDPLSNSYEELFIVANKIGVTPSEQKQLFLLAVMNVLGGNVDDHNKNFSFLMDKDGNWHVAPAYDYTFTIDLSAPGYMNRHSMTMNNKNSYIESSDLIGLAKQFNIRGPESIINNAIEIVRNYEHYAEIAGVNEYWKMKIMGEIESRIRFASDNLQNRGLHR